MHPSSIISHRGLEPSNCNFYTESTLEAFIAHIDQGFSIEADLCFTKDGIILCHDSCLTRLSKGKDRRYLANMATQAALSISLPRGRFGTLYELIESFIKAMPAKGQKLALHFKGKLQTQENCQKLIDSLKGYEAFLSHFLIFDLKPTYAIYLKERLPNLALGGSVACFDDIFRYSSATDGTLLTIEQFLSYGPLYDLAWLDEWDLTAIDTTGSIQAYRKKFYTREVFSLLKAHGKAIAVVSPELHSSSPGLLGGERHPDAADADTLFKRIKEILTLKPDAICSDYPHEISSMTMF